MNMKKILYGAICIGGFAIAFVGLRVIGNALLGIGGIMACIYGLIEVMHAVSTDPVKKPSKSVHAAPEMPAACPHCGAAVPAGNDFRGKCGKKITE